MKTLRIFISSPNDVAEERAKARLVIEALRRPYNALAKLEIVMWEDLALSVDISAQESIMRLLSEHEGVDVAVFILWSRLGSPLSERITSRPDGGGYRSGTEHEFDLMLAAREASGGKKPHILAYWRQDEKSFIDNLKHEAPANYQRLLEQRELARRFIEERFMDEHGRNIRGLHMFAEPVSFAQRLDRHLRQVLDELLAADPAAPTWTESPYRSLEVFEIRHSPIFFGRDEEICDLLQRLRDQERNGCAFACIVGASGSGKSSLARAGVAATLMQRSFDEGVKEWRVAVFLPSLASGDRTLAEALPELHEGVGGIERFARSLEEGNHEATSILLHNAFKTASDKLGGPLRLLLLLDQMEELWTDFSITDERREKFLQVIESLARSGCISVLATLRSDFYPQAQLSEAFLRMKGERGHFDLAPPGTAALHELIVQPAHRAGLTFERDERTGRTLDQRILEDAARDFSALPLLQYALAELYEYRDEEKRMLTFAAYEVMEGVEGALGQRAAYTFETLPHVAQSVLDEMLPLLISVDIAGEQNAVRRRCPLSALTGTPARRQLTEALIAARFLTTDEQRGTAIASLAHEALLRRWDRITTWINTNRDLLRLRARIEQYQSMWEGSGRDASRLLPAGLPLEEGRKLLVAKTQVLDEGAKGFVMASAAHHDDQMRRATRRRRVAFAVLSGLTVIASVAGVFAWQLKTMADKARVNEAGARQTAETARIDAERSQLDAETALRSEEQAKEQALKSQRQEVEARVASENAKEQALSSKQKESEARAVAETAQKLAVERLRESARTDLMIGKEWISKGNRGNAFAYLARAAENDPTLVSAMHTAAIELQSVPVNLSRAVLHHGGEVLARFSEEGQVVTVAEQNTREWDLDGNLLRTIPVDSTGSTYEFRAILGRDGAKTAVHPSGKFVASYLSHGGSVGTGDFSLFDVEKNKITWSGTPPSGGHILGEMKYSPDGKLLATGGLDLYLWNCETGTLDATIPHPEACRSVAFSPDGQVLATGGGDGIVRLYTTKNLSLTTSFEGHKAPVEGLEFSADGSMLLSYDWDQVAKLWKITTKNIISTINFAGQRDDQNGIFGTVSKDGEWVATIGGSGSQFVRIWSGATGKLHRAFPVSGEAKNVSFSPDCHSVMITSSTGDVLISDLEGGSISRVYNMAQSPAGKVESSGSRRYLIENRKLGSIHSWEVIDRATSKIACSFNMRNQSIDAVFLSPDGSVVATSGYTSDSNNVELCLRDSSTGTTTHVLLGVQVKTGSEIGHFAFSDDGKRFVAVVSEGDSDTKVVWIGLWDTASGKRIAKIPGLASPESDRLSIDRLRLDLSGDGKFLAGVKHTLSEEIGEVSRLKIWNAETGAELTAVDLGRGEWSPFFSPDGTRLLVFDGEGTATIYDAISGELLDTIIGPGATLDWAWSPDGCFITQASTEHFLTEWDVSVQPAKETMKAEWDDGSIGSSSRVHYSANGQFITLYGGYNSVGGGKVFERATRSHIATLDGYDNHESPWWFSALPNANEFAFARGASPEGDYLGELDPDHLRIWPWVGIEENTPKWWPNFLRGIGGMGFNSEGALAEIPAIPADSDPTLQPTNISPLAAIPPDSGDLEKVLNAIANEKTPAAEFAKLFLSPSKVVDVSSLNPAPVSEVASVKLAQAEAAGSNHAQSPGKENAGLPSKEISDPAAPILFLLEGRFGAIRLGMTEVEVRKALTEIGETHPGEMPFGRDGKLVYGIDGINFRFTGDGKMFQIYALHESVGMESGLRLNHSTFAEFGVFLGNELKPEVTDNGGKRYYLPDSDLEILLIPADDDPDRVFSVMLTKKSLNLN